MNEHDKRGLYRLLDCNPNSTAAELKKSYRKLALQHHPDREPDASLRKTQHDRMRRLNEAYDVLRDPERRSEYDRDRGFPHCAQHTDCYVSGRCPRCDDPVCPECIGDDVATGGRQLCRVCRERGERRRRTRDPVERALLSLEDGELDEAQEELKRALLLNPRDVVALTALSTVREKRGDWKGAVVALQIALQIKPGHAFSHYRLGNLLSKSGDLVRAREAFQEALRLDPGSAKYRGALSLSQREIPNSAEPRFSPNDHVRHDIFGPGVVTEVTPVGVRVTFTDGGSRWLDPQRAPMIRRAASAAHT